MKTALYIGGAVLAGVVVLDFLNGGSSQNGGSNGGLFNDSLSTSLSNDAKVVGVITAASVGWFVLSLAI